MAINLGAPKVPFDNHPSNAELTGVDVRLRRLREWMSRPSAAIATAILALMILGALLAPIIAPINPNLQAAGSLLPPSGEHLLGTDEFGRDLFSRLIYGARVSLGVGVLAVSIGVAIGITLGLVAGYYGRWADTMIMRASDVVLAYPAILIAIIIVAVFGAGLTRVSIALAVVTVPQFARLVRALVLRERSREYVSASRTIGCSAARILFRHILPNCSGPIFVQFALQMGHAVLLESALSFLGLGVKPPTPSWGSMLSSGRSFLAEAPWYGVFPGVALGLLLISLNLLADALRDHFDPKARQR